MAKYCYLVCGEDGSLVCTVNHHNYKNCDLYRKEVKGGSE
jgi:hypothetical protein